jgi:glycine cleavage system aminomethyltransferase T
MDLREIDSLPVIITMLSILVYYVFSKDRTVYKKLWVLEKGLEEMLKLKVQDFIGHDKWQREENEGGKQELEKALGQRIQQLTDQTEQQRENSQDWKQGLKENLLKFIKIK